jgi:diguanylate cyclase (GGDEF)-like protein/PAS domain S-box-containing protein
MIFKTPTMRLSIVLVLVTVNLLFLADLIGFVPDTVKSNLGLRKSLSESLALQFSAAAEKGEFQTIQNTLRAVVERNKDIRSAAIRTNDGKLLAKAGNHLAYWKAPADGKSTPTYIQVPIFRKKKHWATVEMRFAPLWANNLAFGVTKSFAGLLSFIALSSFLCYFFIIRKTLRQLDPTAVIPERVQKAFNVLQEGVLILDEKEQIVMTNKSFSILFGKSPAEMIGLKGSELLWYDLQNQQQVNQLPWLRAMQDGQDRKGVSLNLVNSHGKRIKLAVNTSTLIDNAGKCRGTLVTFDDISQLEEKNFELSHLVEELQQAQYDIQSKNQELETLANCDPLTLCLNRRSFAKKFDILFTQAKARETHLSCLMVDIDLFKSVNDNYGHATGDKVIKAIADVLKTCTRDNDLLGRYGGEEFCLVLPKIELDTAVNIAERIRQTVEKKPLSGVKITVSIGVSTLEFNTNKPDELVNLADKALYTAKRSGRNRVVAWGKDFNSISQADDEAKIKEQVPQTGKSSTINMDQTQLQRRVLELEGLLEKRAIELRHYKMYDFNTGLPTRSLFEHRISHEIARAKRKNYLVAVLSMTIETIKRVQQTLGYSAASQLMKACGQRLNDVLRGNIDIVSLIESSKDMSTISLINEAEFGIMLTDIKQVDHITWIMKRMLDSFDKPFRIKGNEIYISPYFGVSIFPHDGQTVEELCSRANGACSFAQKLNGKDRYCFSSRSLNEMAVNQLRIENALHEAIQNDELQLYYQPIIEAETGRIVKFETLLRWQSSSLGFVPPDKFIPVAEQTGQIDRIGDWVFYNAVKQLRNLMDTGLNVCPVSINVSGIQLRQQNLANRIQNMLDEFSIDAHLIEIELTESSLIDIYDKSFAILKQLKDMGIRVYMDDFGTGYSSLSYLKNIPLSGLKIDRSFISDVTKDESADKLVASIISMSHGLGLEVVAEGVEEKKQAEYLISLGCEYLQGYYFSRPMPHKKVSEILRTRKMAMIG